MDNLYPTRSHMTDSRLMDWCLIDDIFHFHYLVLDVPQEIVDYVSGFPSWLSLALAATWAP